MIVGHKDELKYSVQIAKRGTPTVLYDVEQKLTQTPAINIMFPPKK